MPIYFATPVKLPERLLGFCFRAVIVIAILFVVSAAGIFVKAIRMLVVEKEPLKVCSRSVIFEDYMLLYM